MPDKENLQLLERYQKLIKLSRDLASTLDLDVLLNRIVHAAADLSDAAEASILLIDEDNGNLYFEAATNESTMRGLIVPIRSSIAGWIIKNRQPIIIGDVPRDGRYFKNIEETVNIPTKSLLGVPLITKGKVVGVLEAINKIDGHFTKQDQEILMTLGVQAAIAIENTCLFQQSDLIAEFVHELRAPLSSISTAAQLLQHPNLPEDKHKEVTQVIQTESIRLSQMATSFLDLSQLESGRYRFDFQLFKISHLLDECANLIEANANKQGLNLRKDYPEDLPAILGDYDKLKQAIINLLSNAVKYNFPGGEVILRAISKNSSIIIQVEDTGIGIPKEHQASLFQKFYRVPGSENVSSGTGLGLTVVKRIVEGHHGDITLDSDQGKGTIFSIAIPTTQQHQNF